MTRLSRASFRTATATGANAQTCVAVAREGDVVQVWDDKQEFSDASVMTFTAEQFDAFLEGRRAGRADGLCITITRRDDGVHEFRSTVPQQHTEVLLFDDGEVAAFEDGIAKREFDMEAFATPAAV